MHFSNRKKRLQQDGANNAVPQSRFFRRTLLLAFLLVVTLAFAACTGKSGITPSDGVGSSSDTSSTSGGEPSTVPAEKIQSYGEEKAISSNEGAAVVPAEKIENYETGGHPSSNSIDANAHSAGSSSDNGGAAVGSSSGQASSSEPLRADASLVVRFIDVGQGDCALISCGGSHLLIDGGPPDASSKVYAILKRLNIARLDYIVASHPDADHIGGISGALNYAQCGICYCSTTADKTETFSSMKRYLEKQGLGITVPTVGDSFALGGATVSFVGPTRELDDTNNNSLVCRVDYGKTSFLFTGDAETEEEMLLLADGANLDADVLKVGHHGSGHSSSPSFLRTISPDYAIISVGDTNTYGHPTQEVLERLAAVGAETLRTDQVGSVLFYSDGSALRYKTTTGAIDE